MIYKIMIIILGSLLISIGINCFLMPFKVLDGGVIGIALIVNYLTGMKVGLIMFLCSIPIFALAWKYDREFFFSSIMGLLISSLTIDLLEPLYGLTMLYLVRLSPFGSAVIGGFLIGSGLGILLRCKSSTGGTDLLAQILTRLSPLNVGIIVFLIDALVVSLGGMLISENTFYLSILTITAGGVATSLCTVKLQDTSAK